MYKQIEEICISSLKWICKLQLHRKLAMVFQFVLQIT